MGEIVDLSLRERSPLSRSERSTMAGEELAGRSRPHRPLAFHGAGEEIVPVKEPAVTPVTVFFKRVTVKLPVAPANRPVPPVMIAFATMVRTFGAVSLAWPVSVPNTVSPLAAVN